METSMLPQLQEVAKLAFLMPLIYFQHGGRAQMKSQSKALRKGLLRFPGRHD